MSYGENLPTSNRCLRSRVCGFDTAVVITIGLCLSYQILRIVRAVLPQPLGSGDGGGRQREWNGAVNGVGMADIRSDYTPDFHRGGPHRGGQAHTGP